MTIKRTPVNDTLQHASPTREHDNIAPVKQMAQKPAYVAKSRWKMSIDAGTSMIVRKCSLLIPPAYGICSAQSALLLVSSSSSNDSSSIQRRLTCKEIVCSHA
jgi:hypothetical protein